MTTTVDRPTFVRPASDKISAGALNALVNHTLLSVKYDLENAEHGTHYLAANNLESSADEALGQTLAQLDPDLWRDVTNTFELGLRIAQVVLTNPLADHRDAVQALLKEVLDSERRARALNARSA